MISFFIVYDKNKSGSIARVSMVGCNSAMTDGDHDDYDDECDDGSVPELFTLDRGGRIAEDLETINDKPIMA